MYYIILQKVKEMKKKNKGPRLQYKMAQIGKSILQKDGLQSEQTLGTTDSGNCSPGMRKSQKTILDWYSYPPAV